MAALEIWIPALVFAHLFAFFWLIKALNRTRPQQQTKSRMHARKKAPAGGLTSITTCSAGGGSNSATVVLPQSQLVHLQWQALGCSYSLHGSTKLVLQDVWGQAQPGEMQALMGPSGAGKSTLMDMLALRKSVGNLTGQLLVNGRRATSSFISQTSYVPQDDTFIPTQTSHETLTFYASMTLGPGWSRSTRRGRVAEVLDALGLAHAADTLVGGTLPGGLHLRGLSGGERRRLSIAAGILGAPSVLFLDEPTSGLDSFAALSVMGHLQHLAQSSQQTVIATIHQPRSDIWEMFDKVSLLSSGRLMFHGCITDILPWFTSLGYTHTRGSVSDWVLDLVATGFSKPEHLFGHTMRSKSDVSAAADAFKAFCIKAGTIDNEAAPATNRNSDNKKDVIADVISDLSPPRGRSSNSQGGTVSDASSSSQCQDTDLVVDVDCEAGSRHNSCYIGSKDMTGLQPAEQESVGRSNRTCYPTKWWAQFTALIIRELAGATRNPFDVAARVLTCTYVGLLGGLLAYDADFFSAQGLQSRGNYLFCALLMMLLLPYISISLYTRDKQIYLAEVSAKTYHPSAYYLAKILVTLPFNLVSTMCYSGITYGMAGLHPGALQFGRYACINSMFALIAHQVLHLCAAVSPNYDVCFALSVVWTTIQLLFCSFFISFNVVAAHMQWLTQLRDIAASYFALEALIVNEFTGRWMDCSNGLPPNQVDTISAGLVNVADFRKTMIGSLKEPQPGCMFNEDVLLSNMGFGRPFGQSVAILMGYLGVLHVLTYAGLLLTARRERR